MNDNKDEKLRKSGKRRWNKKRRKDTDKRDVCQTSGVTGFNADPVGGRIVLDAELKDCSFCGKPVTDTPSALADKTTGEPVHFDCVLKHLAEHENLDKGQTLSYIGQGRFAVISFNSGLPQFSIERIIEWEARDKKYQWRADIAELYSRVR